MATLEEELATLIADLGADHTAILALINSRTPKITPSTTAPASPAVNDLWVVTT